jgi:formyl-CoA transferase
MARLQNRDELTPAIEAIIATADSRTWGSRFDGAGLIWAPVAELPDAFEDETVKSLGIFTEVESPQYGRYQTLNAPFHIRGADIEVRGPAPLAGEHTSDILSEYGFSEEDVATLAAAGVFG